MSRLPPETTHLLNVTARDGGGLYSFTTVTIRVHDVNDHAPVFRQRHYRFISISNLILRKMYLCNDFFCFKQQVFNF